MVTGDNVRTAVSVARECGLVTQSATVFLPSFTSGSPSEPESHIAWTSVDDDDIALDEYSLRPLDTRQQTHLVDDQEEPLEYSLAVTGDVFRWMVDWAPLETFHRVRSPSAVLCALSRILADVTLDFPHSKQMLIKGVIFARMSPDEKHELVERLQELGYTVCFCGDGANDCGALKAADVGISLSEAEGASCRFASARMKSRLTVSSFDSLRRCAFHQPCARHFVRHRGHQGGTGRPRHQLLVLQVHGPVLAHPVRPSCSRLP
jgi:cation-transporting ATPase 13A2